MYSVRRRRASSVFGRLHWNVEWEKNERGPTSRSRTFTRFRSTRPPCRNAAAGAPRSIQSGRRTSDVHEHRRHPTRPRRAQYRLSSAFVRRNRTRPSAVDVRPPGTYDQNGRRRSDGTRLSTQHIVKHKNTRRVYIKAANERYKLLPRTNSSASSVEIRPRRSNYSRSFFSVR